MKFSNRNLLRHGLIAAATGTLLAACVPTQERKPLITEDSGIELVAGTEETLLIVVDDQVEIRKQAEELGLKVEGSAILSITGDGAALASLTVADEAQPQVATNAAVEAIHDGGAGSPDEQVYFLAKRDFALPEWWEQNPTYDGRGVIVGVIDDGVSPVLNGFARTSTGERKYLGYNTNTTSFDFPTTAIEGEIVAGEYLASWDTAEMGSQLLSWQTTINEEEINEFSPVGDMNFDGTLGEIDAAAILTSAGLKVCVDQNVDRKISPNECFGTFAETGEFGSWSGTGLHAIQAEFDQDSGVLSLRPPQENGRGHGEGVASVLVGHQIGGTFDGVAPGAQMLDYNLSSPTQNVEEDRYTIATFIRALEWLGEQGAEVANISYSLFFSSAASQRFMKDALEQIVARYNMVISFSAGNNGPGLGSFNRGLIYPDYALVAGAFVSKDLDEYVHGVTGLPDPGRIVYYSSRGPSPDGGSAPKVISPLASLSHADPNGGFRAFSGTSSASPALAGLATVLISAVKQAGLPVDAGAISRAIIMSGERLVDTPFVEQGGGMPKAAQAFEHYQAIISGEQPVGVDSEFRWVAGEDGVSQTGLMLRASSTQDLHREYTIRSSVRFAGTVSELDAANRLITADVTYSADWLNGPSMTHLSVGSSSMGITIDYDALRLDRARNAGAEFFGEIYLTDRETGVLLHTIPVTVINDTPLTEPLTFQRELAAEEGLRYHIYIPEGTIGMKISADSHGESGANVRLQVYDTNRVRHAGKWNPETGEFFVETPKAGWYQLALGRWKGTALLSRYEVTATPIKLDLRSSTVSLEDGVVEIYNAGPRVGVKVTARPAAPVQMQKFVRKATNELLTFSFPITKAGMATGALSLAQHADVSYLIAYCNHELQGPNEEMLSAEFFVNQYAVELPAESVGGTLTFHCRAFESNDLGSSGMLTWKGTFNEMPADLLSVEVSTVKRLNSGVNTVRLGAFPEGMEIGSEWTIEIGDVFEDSASATLGLGSVHAL